MLDEAVQAVFHANHSTQFYRVVLGGDGDDIHYGHYENDEMTTKEAASLTVHHLYEFAQTFGISFNSDTRVLDSGAGTGGSSIKLHRRTGASFVCLNLCEKQNEMTKQRLEEMKLDDKISVVTGSFDKLPDDWTESFDYIYSIDAFAHTRDRASLLSEAFRVLKPGGALIFSDILCSPKATAESVQFVQARLRVELFTQPKYIIALRAAGFNILGTMDWTGHLKKNYEMVLKRLNDNRHRLNNCSDAYVERQRISLQKSMDALEEGEAQTWHAFVARKPSST